MLQRSRLPHRGANLYRRPHVVAAHTVAIGGWSRTCLSLLCQTNNNIVKNIFYATCLSLVRCYRACFAAFARVSRNRHAETLVTNSLTHSSRRERLGRAVVFIRWCSRRFPTKDIIGLFPKNKNWYQLKLLCLINNSCIFLCL